MGSNVFGFCCLRRSVKLLLAFASTIIPGFSLLEIHDEEFYYLLDMYKFQNGNSSSTKEGSVFLCTRRRYVCCTVDSARVYPRSVTASRSLRTLCILCHCTVLSNVYTRYTEGSACYPENYGSSVLRNVGNNLYAVTSRRPLWS
jgi:hypothetical protein